MGSETAPKVELPPVLEHLHRPYFFRWQPYIRLATVGLTVGMTGYLILLHDFGPKEHCFSPIRRFYTQHTQKFWQLDAKDEQEIKVLVEQGRKAA